MWPANACAQTPFALTPFAAGCYGMGMERAANHLPPDRKANERERAYFKWLCELEEAVPKFGSRPPRQLGEVLEELARHRAQWPMLPQTDDLAEHLAEREAMMRKSDAGSAASSESAGSRGPSSAATRRTSTGTKCGWRPATTCWCPEV